MTPIMSTDNNQVVRIFGKNYEIDSGLTPLEISTLASYVDDKMTEIADKLHLVDTQKIAVLAALNIALELRQENKTEEMLGEEAEKKLTDMITLLDNARDKS